MLNPQLSVIKHRAQASPVGIAAVSTIKMTLLISSEVELLGAGVSSRT
jgi:3-phosphoglycerate kinase